MSELFPLVLDIWILGPTVDSLVSYLGVMALLKEVCHCRGQKAEVTGQRPEANFSLLSAPSLQFSCADGSPWEHRCELSTATHCQAFPAEMGSYPSGTLSQIVSFFYKLPWLWCFAPATETNTARQYVSFIRVEIYFSYSRFTAWNRKIPLWKGICAYGMLERIMSKYYEWALGPSSQIPLVYNAPHSL